jgi:hypothetical protein
MVMDVLDGNKDLDEIADDQAIPIHSGKLDAFDTPKKQRPMTAEE